MYLYLCATKKKDIKEKQNARWPLHDSQFMTFWGHLKYVKLYNQCLSVNKTISLSLLSLLSLSDIGLQKCQLILFMKS